MSNPHVTAGIRTIVCGTDFSQPAELALRHAHWLAAQTGARLVLAHAIDSDPPAYFPIPRAEPDPQARLHREAGEKLSQLSNTLFAEEGQGEKVELETQVLTGPSGPALIGLATSMHADLVVLATRGQTGIGRLLFGSTAEYVTSRADCPVFCVHPDDREPSAPIRRVVLPTDLTPDSYVALDDFLPIFDRNEEPEAILVFAEEAPGAPDEDAASGDAAGSGAEGRRSELEAKLSPVLERLDGMGFAARLEVSDARPAQAIVDLAQEVRSDLIVMCTRGGSARTNPFIGHVTQRVLRNARCPVLTVRPASPGLQWMPGVQF